MAARTSTSIGVGVTITLLGASTLGLFIATIIFLSKYQAAQRNLDTFNSEMSEFVTTAERSSDDVRLLLDAARSDRSSLVGYLKGSLGDTMQKVTGSSRDTYDRLTEKLASVPGTDSASALQVMRDQRSRISDLEGRLSGADADRQAALEDLQNQIDRSSQRDATHRETITALNLQIDQYKSEVESYRSNTDDVQQAMQQRVDQIRRDADEEIGRLGTQIADLQENLAVTQDQLRNCRGQRSTDRFVAEDEFALVDATVIATEAGANTVTIDRGRRDKIALGMAFAAYDEPSNLRPDAAGNYPRGKATLEVIHVNEASSTCRVIVSTRGNPVVRGNVVANPIYDPNKVYKFLVFGNFDANRDGRWTPREQTDIHAMIESLPKNKVVDDISGDLDFLVLGRRPILPPEPPADAPIEIIQHYINQSSIQQRYDELFQQATQTSIPVLNENRLYTLLGKDVAPIR